LAFLRELVAIVGRLGTKKILLDSEGNFFGSDENDDEDWMGVTVDKLMDEGTRDI
jgi:hypothetical protein